MQPIVMKFGGTSVEDAQAYARVARLIESSINERPVVVVSAMSGMTDALLKSVEIAKETGAEQASLILEEHFARHKVVSETLLSQQEIEDFRKEMDAARREVITRLLEIEGRVSTLPALQDEIASCGERLSATLLAAVLRRSGTRARHVDARQCIVTDERFGRAEPLMEETTRRTSSQVGAVLEAGEIAVVGGFIAATVDGRTTTLGRGGSDYTAALIGASLEAREIQIWTDVAGVLTADPRVVRRASTIARLSYAEAAELAYFGAKVLHPKTILPAVVRGIPVRICNSLAPEGGNTAIYFDTEKTPRTVKAIVHKKGITIVHVTSARMLGAYGFLRALFEVFDRHQTIVDLVTTSEVSVSLSLEDTSALALIVKELEEKGIGAVKVEHNRALVCVVGEGLRNTSGIAARVFTAVRDINVMLISQGASSINLTFVVEENLVEQAVRNLHQAFFESNTRELYKSAMRDA